MSGNPKRNQLHQVDFGKFAAALPDLITDFEKLLEDARAKNGIGESALLKWFGSSIEHIAFLAYATHSHPPTHVAREFDLTPFRSDFFWVCLDDTAEPVVCAVELEGALADTLFRKKSNRAEPYYGAKFLDGFSQLVDWCSFGRSAAESSYKISSLFPDNSIPVYEYCLIAGLSSFAVDQSLKKRLNWWNQHIKLGNGTKTFTFDGLLAQGKKNINSLQKMRPLLPS